MKIKSIPNTDGLEKVIVETEDGPIEAYVLTDEYQEKTRQELNEIIDLDAFSQLVESISESPPRPANNALHSDVIPLARYWTDEQGRRLVHYFQDKDGGNNDEQHD